MRRSAYLLCLSVVLVAPGCQAAKPSEAQGVVPELKLDDVRFRVYRGDDLRAFGDARGAALRRDSSDVRARDLVATLPRQGAPIRITAPAGEGALASRVFEVHGGVTASRRDDVARTERARYEPTPGDGIVSGDRPVVLEGTGYRLEGAGFTLDPGAGDIVVSGGARLTTGLRAPEAVR
jgi:lipopolysaccharide export system protein LptC